MLTDIQRIHKIAHSAHRLIIGLMSGTSLDGLDVALCKITGHGTQTKVELQEFTTVPFTKEQRNRIKFIFAKNKIDFPYFCALNAWVGDLHASLILDCLKTWNINPASVDVIASHGQTVMHAPAHQHKIEGFPNSTLQIGDGDRIAVKTGIITVSDFRQKHLAAGGEGAPLAVYGDYLIFSDPDENRIMLNMGGIANFTYLPAGRAIEKVFVTDTGPGNTMMDAYMQLHFNKTYDKNAETASIGEVHQKLLAELKNHYYFRLPFPKTTGPEVFNLNMLAFAQQQTKSKNLSDADVMATLNRFSAESIADGIRSVISDNPFSIYLSGGGSHNSLLISHLKSILPNCAFYSSEKLGIPGDAKEAVLFAILANECLTGDPTEYSDSNPSVPKISMGKISLPF
ncbi:MAG: anhydro-N-acetylmuramic acid kinase [Saprospiraceae bacterium]|nr:anhydro-N-acetylmuramic acid kinase [Saprospiraceae bacterium]